MKLINPNCAPTMTIDTLHNTNFILLDYNLHWEYANNAIIVDILRVKRKFAMLVMIKWTHNDTQTNINTLDDNPKHAKKVEKTSYV
jgi:hypothetical protein